MYDVFRRRRDSQLTCWITSDHRLRLSFVITDCLLQFTYLFICSQFYDLRWPWCWVNLNFVISFSKFDLFLHNFEWYLCDHVCVCVCSTSTCTHWWPCNSTTRHLLTPVSSGCVTSKCHLKHLGMSSKTTRVSGFHCCYNILFFNRFYIVYSQESIY